MMTLLKSIAALLPNTLQQALKKLRFFYQIKKGIFSADEPEFSLLSNWVSSNNWVIDIGANVGHYSLRLSELVGEHGRVFAFEPILESFELLTVNSSFSGRENICLINAAASDRVGLVAMSIPRSTTGLKNYYMAKITDYVENNLWVFCIPIDTLNLPQKISFVKVDAEGHELAVLRGMEKLLLRDQPTLVIEGASKEVESFLYGLNYQFTTLKGSPNRIYTGSKGQGLPY